MAGKFRWLKHCRGAPRQRGGFDSLAGRHHQKNIVRMKKPIKTIRVGTDTRTYYIDLRKDNQSQPYVTLTEIPVSDTSRSEKARVFIYGEHLDRMIEGLSRMKEEVRKNEAER